MEGITESLASNSLAIDLKSLHGTKMCSSWDKVRSFLDMMDVPELNSPLPFSSTFSLSSSCDSNTHPLSIGAKSWLVGEKTIKQILSVIQPTTYSEYRRKEIIGYIQRLIGDAFGIKVFPFGSVPLKTYLPHGDVDLTVVSYNGTSEVLAAEICCLLEREENNNGTIPVRDVLCVPAQVRVVKCIVGDIAVDISFNQTAGLCALYFLEQVDQFIGKDHLFKRSVILIKAWCYYESRLLGGYHGLISTYALETMVLHVINVFHSLLHCPLAVLYKFLEYYSTFDWKNHCIGINGLVLLSSLPKIEVVLLHGCDELLLTEEFLRSCRDSFSLSIGVVGSNNSVFPVKFMNILDPLRDDNNLGRSVSKGNFYRIKYALSLGAQKLTDILMLPPEKIRVGLEKFFQNTLERNGKGSRVDVLVPVPTYGSELSAPDSDSDNLLATFQCDLWVGDCHIPYGVLHSTSATSQVWNNGWGDLGQNMLFDQSVYYDFDESPPSSVDTPRDLRLNHAISVEERWRPGRSFSSVDNTRSFQVKNAASGEEKWRQNRMPSSIYNPRGLRVDDAASVEEKWKSRRTYSSEYNQRGTQLDNAASAEEKWKPRRTYSSEYNQRGAQLDNAASAEEKWKTRAITSSVFSPRSPRLDNEASDEDKWKARGTYSAADNLKCLRRKSAVSALEKWKPSRATSMADCPISHNRAPTEETRRSNPSCPYVPHIENILQTNLTLEESVKEHEVGEEQENKKEEESEKEDETVDSQACTSREEDLSSDVAEDSSAVIYSMEDFPLLPGSKPILTRECSSAYIKSGQVQETSISPDSTVLVSLKPLLSVSLSLSEAGKQSDSDGSVIVDARSDPIIAAKEKQDSTKSDENQASTRNKEKVEVPVKPLQLTDNEEFPPLSRPAKPPMPLSKKEFPPLSACRNSNKKGKSKKYSKKEHNGGLKG